MYAIAPLGADEDDSKMMASMAEFVCHANYGLKNGNFELDMRDGEIRFKSFVDCEGITPTLDMVRNSIHCPAAMFERYGDGIVGIIFGGMSAKEAVDRCEKGSEDEIRSMLSDLGVEDAGGDVESLISRLAARLGITEGGEDCQAKEESGDYADSIRLDLFAEEGGAA